MKRITILLLSFTLVFNYLAKADEGMWFLAFLNKNYNEMKAKGMKITVEDIYSINKSSLKDAVVALDGGSCTGEIVSPKGLLFTNHHCGYGEIQAHSTVEHDYLQNGFWASSLSEELPNPGKTVSFLIKMEDVSQKILSKVTDDMTEKIRNQIIKKTIKEIQETVTAGTNYEAEILSMYDGNAYYLFIYETYKDIRLVGAPPSSIGKYGGDTDNWMWPRHTGDFSIFRVYTAPDGSPAEYSANNIPLKPKKYFKINLNGVKEDDFAMIMGYPGTTNRYLTSWEVKEVYNNENTIRVKVRTEKLNILRKYMSKSHEDKIKYAAKFAQSANYWKYSEGQNLGLDRLKVAKRKKKLEKKLKKWYKTSQQKQAKYGEMFDIILKAVKKRKDADIALKYWFEAIYLGPEFQKLALKTIRLYQMLQTDDPKNIDAETTKELIETAEEFFKDYNPVIDRELFIKLTQIYIDNTKEKYKSPITTVIKNEYEGDIQKYAKDIYSNSIFTNYEKYLDFLEKPNFDILAEDVGFIHTLTIVDIYSKTILDDITKINKDYGKGRRLYLDAIMKMYKETDPDKLYYPDANSSLRLTYGTVGGYKYENLKYNYFTTLDEYIKKEDPNNPEFEVSDRTKELYKAKDYGRYKDKDGTLHIDFLTNNDITGGNSGSPVLDANGNLIGIAFDGNWEGMSGDIAFEPEFQKTINVDIRYVLWVIDKYANATNIINELNIVQ